MSYNVCSILVLEGELRVDSAEALTFADLHKHEMAELNWFDSIENPVGDTAIKPQWAGMSSGGHFKVFLESLEMTKGEATLLVIWEDGDSVQGYSVKDGFVCQGEIRVY